MDNFNKQRFCKYANWDLTINRGFYRNLALVIFFTLLGVTVCSFLIRWGMYDVTDSVELFSAISGTGAIIFSILTFELFVASGCVFHPLRNKQGRITNLTLPATSLEKYLWHICLCVVGIVVVGVASVAVCDALNALMTVCIVDNATVRSIFTTTFNPVNWGAGDMLTVYGMGSETTGDKTPYEFLEGLVHSSVFFIYAAVILQSGIYTFGNSVRYKYNIPLTYVILQFTGFILFILLIVVIAVLNNSLKDIDEETVKSIVMALPTIIYTVAAVLALLGVLFFVWAYSRYTRAQLTSHFDK